MDNLNRKINQTFFKIANTIYANDQKNGDTLKWWPIRPTKIDSPLAPFLFSELIRLFKKAESKTIPTSELLRLIGSREVIGEMQFLWPSLGWKPVPISLEDKLYLIKIFLDFSEQLPSDPKFQDTFVRLGEKVKERGELGTEELLREGTLLYMAYFQRLYEYLGESWQDAQDKAIKVVLEKQGEVETPGPWGDTSPDKAVRRIVRNSDFRREKEKGLEQVLTGVPEVPGIAEGVVGENIIVGFTIRDIPDEADAFILNVAAFNMLNVKKELESKGIVVISKTRSGTRQLKNGEKVLVDGTSGLVFTL